MKQRATFAVKEAASREASLRWWLHRSLVALLLAAFLIQLVGIFRRNIHWDEFLFLSNIYRSIAGEPLRLLQTSYVHLFGWLTSVGENEIDQIIAARGLYLIIWAGSLGLLYRLGRRLQYGEIGALVGVALFALFPFSLVHAVSFRIDGLLLPCLLAIALLLSRPSTPRLLLAGVGGALALALSIKAVLWAPALLGILILSHTDPKQAVKRSVVVLVSATAALAGLLLLRAGLTDGAAIAISLSELKSIAYRMFLEEGVFPNRWVFVESVWSYGAIWLMIAFGAYLAARDLSNPENRVAAARQLFAASPVVSLLFYANAWQYAYVILLPTTCLLAGRAISFLVDSGEAVRRFVAVACLVSASIPLMSIAWIYQHDGQHNQAQVLSIVHRMFPEPVAYIDKTGIISSFRRQPLPLTGQVIKHYRRIGKPAVKQFIKSSQPPLLIANSGVLDVWNDDLEAIPARFRLLPEDEAMIRKTYAPYWGPIYLAGRQWEHLNAGELVQFDIVVAGAYTLLSDSGVIVGDRVYQPGASFKLEAGRHHLETTESQTNVRLLWGRDLQMPPEAPGPQPIFLGYGPT